MATDNISIPFVESQACPQSSLSIYRAIPWESTKKTRKTVMIFNKMSGTIYPSEAHEFTPIFSGVTTSVA